jgi:hypothetical protein
VSCLADEIIECLSASMSQESGGSNYLPIMALNDSLPRFKGDPSRVIVRNLNATQLDQPPAIFSQIGMQYF